MQTKTEQQTHYFATSDGTIDGLRELDPKEIATAHAAGKCRAVHRYDGKSYLSVAGKDWDYRKDHSVPMSGQTWTSPVASVDQAISLAEELY